MRELAEVVYCEIGRGKLVSKNLEKILLPPEQWTKYYLVWEWNHVLLRSFIPLEKRETKESIVLLLSLDTHNELAVIGSPPKVPSNLRPATKGGGPGVREELDAATVFHRQTSPTRAPNATNLQSPQFRPRHTAIIFKNAGTKSNFQKHQIRQIATPMRE